MVFKHWGMYNIQDVLRDLGHVSAQGANLYTASELAKEFGFEAVGFHCQWEALCELSLPFIVHYRGDHFIVVTKVTEDRIRFIDPAYGEDDLSKDTFLSRWNGVALTVEPTEDAFRNQDLMELVEERRTRKRSLFREFYLPPLYELRKVLA